MTTWFGNTDGSAGSIGLIPNSPWGQAFSAPASGAVASARMNLGSSGGAVPTKIVIYAESGGAPAALLGASGEVTISAGSAQAVRTYTFTTTVPVVSGTSYFLMIFPGGAGLETTHVAVGTSYYRTVTYPTAPDPFGTPSSLAGYRFYLEAGIEEGGGGGGGGALAEHKAGAASVDPADWNELVDAVVTAGGAVATRKAGSAAVDSDDFNAVIDAVVALGGAVRDRKAGASGPDPDDFNALVDAVDAL